MRPQVCQSCAFPLVQGSDVRGTESNGEKSEVYCAYCYSNGKFIEPNISYADMLAKGFKKIDNANGGKLKKFVFKKTYPGLLKNCSRWSYVR